MSKEDSSKENGLNECPVCYDQLQAPSTSERRLSCGHSFCHDCLVKYLMTAKKEGSIKKNIICPLCRYVTFLSKRGLVLPPKHGDLHQILEVPLTPSCLRHSPETGSLNTLVIPIAEASEPNGLQDHQRCTCQVDSNLDVINHTCGSQIFVISDQGRPMDSEETAATQTTHHVDARVNCCHSPSLILILLMILLVAVLAAVLPWILLVKRT